MRKASCLVHTKAMNLCSLFSRKQPQPKRDVLIHWNTDGVPEVRKGVNVCPVLGNRVVNPN